MANGNGAPVTGLTPAMISEQLIRAHEQWRVDEVHGKLAEKPFDRRYLATAEFRDLVAVAENNGGYFDQVAWKNSAVRYDWTDRRGNRQSFSPRGHSRTRI